MDDAAAEGLVPGVDAEDEIQLVAKALEIGGVFVQPFPDARGKNLGVVVFVKEILKLREKLGDDAVRALGLPIFGLAGVFVLRVSGRAPGRNPRPCGRR